MGRTSRVNADVNDSCCDVQESDTLCVTLTPPEPRQNFTSRLKFNVHVSRWRRERQSRVRQVTVITARLREIFRCLPRSVRRGQTARAVSPPHSATDAGQGSRENPHRIRKTNGGHVTSLRSRHASRKTPPIGAAFPQSAKQGQTPQITTRIVDKSCFCSGNPISEPVSRKRSQPRLKLPSQNPATKIKAIMKTGRRPVPSRVLVRHFCPENATRRTGEFATVGNIT